MNSTKLKAMLVERGISPEEAAKRIGVSKTAFYRKLRGVSEFKQSEISGLVNMLGMEDQIVREVFFTRKVS